MKEILDVVQKTIYQFFDVCGDDEEVPISDKDKLLLEVNKAICDNLKALDQESILLDKIRAEIEQIADEEQKDDEKWAIGLLYSVKIIDKYIAEGSDKAESER